MQTSSCRAHQWTARLLMSGLAGKLVPAGDHPLKHGGWFHKRMDADESIFEKIEHTT
ncbi:hypothetical protein RY831_11910 [Noviherbaspirillum sp. CPCC 100848]|uniref:Uncharacterized protein n=1 Tax=Noviherbaspirillum album TaxID=3080276 RepID=A0ABU6J887_9BURK|nr:hypothetical protein [Noviherbaspirillum sp. CPCC 100848]MEC4719858.1 hypothetical protein [Noviherbaspirillum sp. CPCC 100848]